MRWQWVDGECNETGFVGLHQDDLPQGARAPELTVACDNDESTIYAAWTLADGTFICAVTVGLA